MNWLLMINTSTFHKIPNGVKLSQSKYYNQGAAESNQIFTGSIDGVDNILVKNFECCFLRQILTTVMLKIDRLFDHFWANFNYDNSKNREIQPLGLDLAQKWSNNLIFKNWDLAILNFRPCIFSVNCIPEAPSWVLTNSPFSLKVGWGGFRNKNRKR